VPVTEEPRGLNWINNINPSAFGVIVSQLCWFIGSVCFTWVAQVLMLRQDGPALINGMPISHDSHRQLGFLLAGALLAAWTGKTAANVVDQQLKRKANPDYVPVAEAIERGKVAGAAAAAVVKEAAKDAAAARAIYNGPAPLKEPTP
jgi:hypothetical protein